MAVALPQRGGQRCMWSTRCSAAAFSRIDPSRGHQVLVDLLDGFEATLVSESTAVDVLRMHR